MSDFGLAAALDIKGNMRVYDIIWFRKIAKVSSN